MNTTAFGNARMTEFINNARRPSVQRRSTSSAELSSTRSWRHRRWANTSYLRGEVKTP